MIYRFRIHLWHWAYHVLALVCLLDVTSPRTPKERLAQYHADLYYADMRAHLLLDLARLGETPEPPSDGRRTPDRGA